MLTLSLLRHAKSSWDDDRLPDFDRPLAPRGRKAVRRMGQHMRDVGLRPNLVLCSPAVRTRETAALALAAYGTGVPPVTYDEAIYEAEWTALRDRLRRVDDSVAHVLMIGHNPGLQELALNLAGGRLSAEHERLHEKLPTAALVVIEAAITSWRELGTGPAAIAQFVTPRDLKDGMAG